MEDKALILSGPALSYLEHRQALLQQLIDFAETCVVVIACRMSPKQK
jgi:magnesium-transporting ATPase (P-type)